MPHREQIPEGGVAVNISVRIALEPFHRTRALGNLMWNLAILSLKLLNEAERFAHAFGTANVEKRALTDIRLVKEPRIHGTSTCAGGTVPGNITASEIRVANFQLIQRDP